MKLGEIVKCQICNFINSYTISEVFEWYKVRRMWAK